VAKALTLTDRTDDNRLWGIAVLFDYQRDHLMPQPETAKCPSASRQDGIGWKADALALGLIFILTILVYGHLWRPGYTPYSKDSDIVAQHLTMKWAAFRSVSAGHGLPFWKSDQFSGSPALSNPQSLYTNPFHFLFNFMDPTAAAGPTLWVNFLIMALSMYVWGWSLGVGVVGRFFMALAGLLNFKLIIAAYAGWLPVLPPLALCPLLLATVTYVIRQPGMASTAVFGMVGAIFLVSGHQQHIYYTALLAISYFLTVAPTMGWRLAGRAAFCLTVGAILAFGCTAYFFLPILAEHGLTSRSLADYDFFLSGRGLRLRHLLTFLYPEWLGTPVDNSCPDPELWEDVAYFGLIPLILALAGIVMGWFRSPTRWLGGAAAICLLLAADTPVGRFLFDWFPGYAVFRQPSRILFMVSFLGIALAAVGIEELRTRWRARRLPKWPMIAFLAGVLLAMTVEGAYYVHRYVTMAPQSEVIPRTSYADFFAKDSNLFRIAPVGCWTINYGWAGPMNLQFITGYDPYNLRLYQTYFDLLIGASYVSKGSRTWTDFDGLSRPDMLDALNVKYLIFPIRASLPEDRFELVAEFHDQPTFALYTGLIKGNTFIYRNRTCLPRAYWADKVVGAADEQDMIEKVRQNDLNATTVALGQTEAQMNSPSSPGDDVAVTSARGGHLALRASCAKRRYLVVSEVWHPGWQATLDGKPAELFCTNVALMGMWVEPGSHQIELNFRPMHWGLALTLSGASGAALVALGIAAAWRARRDKICSGVKPKSAATRSTLGHHR
jgi:hypothetical protein